MWQQLVTEWPLIHRDHVQWMWPSQFTRSDVTNSFTHQQGIVLCLSSLQTLAQNEIDHLLRHFGNLPLLHSENDV